jgi:hypothetical protein
MLVVPHPMTQTAPTTTASTTVRFPRITAATLPDFPWAFLRTMFGHADFVNRGSHARLADFSDGSRIFSISRPSEHARRVFASDSSESRHGTERV